MNASTVKLVLLFSPELEATYVSYLAKKLSWYAEQEYTVKLPKGIDDRSSAEDIQGAVGEEYVEADYEACIDGVMREWVAVADGFEIMRKVPAFQLQDEYIAVFTKYGMGGSYNSDIKRIIVRLNPLMQKKMVATIVHEIVHTSIQYMIDKYKVGHWRKERLVDLLVEHYFPGLKKMQDIKEDVAIVDNAFIGLFPDIESVVQTIGDQQTQLV